MANFPLPKGYQRMGAFPLDATSVFNTLEDLQAYASTNGTAYPGQICTVGDVPYKINTDKTVSALGAGGTIDYGEF